MKAKKKLEHVELENKIGVIQYSMPCAKYVLVKVKS